MIDFKSRWDNKTGLFLIAPGRKGHDLDCFGMEGLHPLTDSVSFMTYAAQVGRLDEIDCLRILETIKKCQFTDKERRGQIKWFLEDRDKPDKNASFFICVGLIPLKKYYSKELGRECCKVLDQILSEVLHFFIKKSKDGGCYYPNSFLGDLVFAWLLNEMYGSKENEDDLFEIIDDSIKYWLEEHWGWGEHMSDGYSKVCCDEISMLLLMSGKLPESTRKLYMEALKQLLEIEESFGGKPRVPTIRSYAFENPPATSFFRQRIRNFQPDEILQIENLPPIGQILNKLGWHKMAPPMAKPKKEIKVACFNETEASALIEDDFRIGAMSRYPIMECTGYLPWQVFPVAFMHDDGDWGFLQWLSEEDGTTYANPSHTKNYGINRGLSATIRPPIGGNTFSIQEGGNLLVLRRMPTISMAWTKLVDRLRVVSPTAQFTIGYSDDRCSTLLFKWPDNRMLSVARVTLSDVPTHMQPRFDGKMLDWDIEYTEFPDMNDTVTLWAFSLDAEINEPPVIRKEKMKRRPVDPENSVFDLEWQTGKYHWNMKIDPVAGSFKKNIVKP
jgi:hypothetical protein